MQRIANQTRPSSACSLKKVFIIITIKKLCFGRLKKFGTKGEFYELKQTKGLSVHFGIKFQNIKNLIAKLRSEKNSCKPKTLKMVKK